MIRHLFLLIWNRKRLHVLVMVELFFCFFVVTATVVAAVYCVWQYQYPLGFSHERVWKVSIENSSTATMASGMQQDYDRLQRLLRALRSHGSVESAAAIGVVPFSSSNRMSRFADKGNSVSTGVNSATPEVAEVMQIDMLYGRWFQQDDGLSDWIPMVINEKLSVELFGTSNSVGKIFPPMFGEERRRVIGVISDFRQDGELAQRDNYFFSPVVFTDTVEPAPSNIVIKVAPGTPMEVEEELFALAKAEVPEWDCRIDMLEKMHEQIQRQHFIPIVVAGIVACFLLLMVVLGLIGVIWQNVTRRTGEFGLRRAVGGTAGDIYLQIFGELFALTTFSLAAGLIVALQVPLLQVISGVPTAVYVIGFVASVLFMYAVALSCGLYPSMLATRIQPTEALHYE